MKIDVEEILLLLVVLFGLYIVMNRCGCNIDSGFSVGGDNIKNKKTDEYMEKFRTVFFID